MKTILFALARILIFIGYVLWHFRLPPKGDEYTADGFDNLGYFIIAIFFVLFAVFFLAVVITT